MKFVKFVVHAKVELQECQSCFALVADKYSAQLAHERWHESMAKQIADAEYGSLLA